MKTISIQQQKKELREKLRHIVRDQQTPFPSAFPAPLIKSDEKSATTFILNQVRLLPAWSKARTVLLYAPLPHEPNLLALLEKSSHRFFFPRMENNELSLYEWLPEARWIAGPHGVQEPDPTQWKRASLAEVDLALIPGLAFDCEGNRLGWGRGYFDRLLGNPTCRALKIGIAWPWQIVPKIPREDHDITMDVVVTVESCFVVDDVRWSNDVEII